MPHSGPYWYTAYGLRFRSEIELPFQDAEPGEADVTVRLGEVPESLGDGATGRGLWRAEPGRFLMCDNKDGLALVENGRDIVVNTTQVDALRIFLTGSALTALLQQRGLVTLHASAVVIGGAAAAFIGRSGAGKSTLAAEFARRGVPMLADDVTALRIGADGAALAEPAYPFVNLWRGTMDAFDMSVDSAHRRMAEIDKYLAPMENFHDRPAPLKHLYVLSPHERGDFSMVPVAPDAVFRTLTQNMHRMRSAMALGQWPIIFQALTEIAAATPAVMASRPREGFRVAELADAILAHASAGNETVSA